MNASDYRELREEILRTVPLPDLDEIHRRGRRRQVATNPTWAIGAIVVVMAAVIVGVSVTSRPAPPVGIADRPDLGTPIHQALSGERIPTDGPFEVLNTVTIDKWTTYAVARSSASVALVRTFDGGTTWQAWTLPAEIASAKLVGFDSAGPGQAVGLVVNRGGASHEGGQDILYVSLDGGQTWAKEPRLGSSVDAFPQGWPLDVRQKQVVAIDPANGVPHPLRKKWEVGVPYLGEPRVVEATDGSLWRIVWTSEAPDSRVEVSRDRGRTWTSMKLPVATREGYSSGYRSVDSYDGKTAYVMAGEMEQQPKGSGFPKTTSSLYVSHDGGATWSLVNKTSSDSWSSLVVLPNGVLLTSRLDDDFTSRSRPLLASHDGGRTFQVVSAVGTGKGLMASRIMRSASGGYVVLTQRSAGDEMSQATINRWFVTTDGMTWTPAPEPPKSSTTPWDVNSSPNR